MRGPSLKCTPRLCSCHRKSIYIFIKCRSSENTLASVGSQSQTLWAKGQPLAEVKGKYQRASAEVKGPWRVQQPLGKTSASFIWPSDRSSSGLDGVSEWEPCVLLSHSASQQRWLNNTWPSVLISSQTGTTLQLERSLEGREKVRQWCRSRSWLKMCFFFSWKAGGNQRRCIKAFFWR